MDRDDIAVFDAEIVADNSIYACAAVIKIIIGENDENRVFPLLALNQDCVATEELKRLHGVVREGDDRVVIVNGVGDTGAC
jgi:hypothetical protein